MKSERQSVLRGKALGGEFHLQVAVKSITKGKCPRGHHPGESWVIKEGKTPEGICLAAFDAIFPSIRVLRFGGEYWWDKDKDVTYISCPDYKHQVIFELRRLREE